LRALRMEPTIESLTKQLEEYESQLAIVESALEEDPTQTEFLQVQANLVDMINITQDCLQLKKETDLQNKTTYPNINEIATSRGIYVGMPVEAMWEDSAWYKGSVTTLSVDGITVTFSEYGNISTLPPDKVRPRKATDVIVVDSKNVSEKTYSSKNTIVVDKHSGELVLPASLKILPTDSEQVRKLKKKGDKSIKK